MPNLSLQKRIAILVFASITLPMTFNAMNIYCSFQEDYEKAGLHVRDVANSFAKRIEAELQARVAALEVLALSRALAANDLPAFRRQAEAVLERQPAGSNIVLVDPNGQQILNTALPTGAPLPLRQYLDNQNKVFSSGRPSISDIYSGQGIGRPVIAIEVPVFGPDGRTRLVLALNPTLDAFSAVIHQQLLEANWAATILDRNGLRIGRVPGNNELIGTRAPEEFLVASATRAEGMTRVTSSEGVRLLVAYRHLEGVGWTVAVGTPVADLTWPAWQRAMTSLVVGGILLLVGLAIARLVANSVLQPIAGLRDLVTNKDDTKDYVPSGLREADEVAEAFLLEATRRKSAIEALMDSERRLRLIIAELNHRAKNVLATVQALAFQTARGEVDLAQFQTLFSARLRSLARAHDLITTYAWQATALSAVLRTGLTPWLEHSELAPQIIIDTSCTYESVPVSPSQAQALVLALHELATNATKYGALSDPGGCVAITCGSFDNGKNATVQWIETGGPAVSGPPTHHGFGMRLLRRALQNDLGPGSQVDLDFCPEGLKAVIRIKAREQPPTIGLLDEVSVDQAAGRPAPMR